MSCSHKVRPGLWVLDLCFDRDLLSDIWLFHLVTWLPRDGTENNQA